MNELRACRTVTISAPFTYFGGKSLARQQVWAALGNPPNYVEPFAGSLAMLLGRQQPGKIETVNDNDAFITNFWRAISLDAAAVAEFVDWPVNETDLFARHSWLMRQSDTLKDRLHGDPDAYDAKIAGWWCWGACCWIGSGWCSGNGPWVWNGATLVDRRLHPDLNDAGQGVHRQLPRLSSAGQGVHRQPRGGRAARTAWLHGWFAALQDRLRCVRVCFGDWTRVLTPSVTTKNGVTGVFLDPPYTTANMDYSIGGVGGELAGAVRDWCLEHGADPLFRIVLCGHAGEHDALLDHGWSIMRWKPRPGYAIREAAKARSASETLWCSPHCLPDVTQQSGLFDSLVE